MFTKPGARLLAPSILVLLVSGIAALSLLPSDAPATSPQVNVFPSPGSRVVSPKTQIAFRGLPVAQLGTIVVRGSRSGVHGGRLLSDSDGRGGSFIPAKPFTPGETVTVSTGLNVSGGSGGTFRLTVDEPAGGIPAVPLPAPARVRGDVLRFHSRADLVPAAATTARRAGPAAPGDIFVAPQNTPVRDGPMILDPGGGLVWFRPLPRGNGAADFRVQSYGGRPVLTWWQGVTGPGVGTGEDVIYDSFYRQLAVVHGANGLRADLHEFALSPQGTALITAYNPIYWDASSVHGSKREIVFDSVVQEIDIPTGLVLFQWDSLDHVPLTDSHTSPTPGAKSSFDYFHINSIDQDPDGNLVISARNTWAAYKVNRQTGAVIWRLGGKHSSFRLGAGATFAFQHDVRVRAQNDLFITLFDDGAGPPTIHRQSRGLKLILDLTHMTARRVAQHEHSSALLANFEGNFQQLPDGDDFLGWGQQPYFSEYNVRGQLVFDGKFVAPSSNYRAYRFPWTGTPLTPPAVAVSNKGADLILYVSWNGATKISSWRVLGGGSANALRPVVTTPKRGFEAAIRIPSQRYVAVQALDSAAGVLGTSGTVRAR